MSKRTPGKIPEDVPREKLWAVVDRHGDIPFSPSGYTYAPFEAETKEEVEDEILMTHNIRGPLTDWFVVPCTLKHERRMVQRAKEVGLLE